MKKIILLLFFVHLTIAAFCQTVTIIDLKKLSKGEDPDKILVSKSYQLMKVKTKHPQSHNQIIYVINNNTPKAELIQIGPGVPAKDGTLLHDISYLTRDTNYVHAIMKQVNMSGIELTDKKNLKSQTTYSFDNKKLFVQVVIKKHNTLQSSVELHNKL
jgi:hypothetical protein